VSNGKGFESKRHIRSKNGHILPKTQNPCAYCGKQLHFTNDFTKDHLIPKAREGDQDFADTVHGQAFVSNI
jgi:hypothetical protein